MNITTKTLLDTLSQKFSWLTEHGFTYFKSYRHFRKKESFGFSYLALDCVTRNAKNYHLAFSMGVRHDNIEHVVKTLTGDTSKLTHYDRSIWNYTENIGPTSPHWTYPIDGDWYFSSLEEVDTQFHEIEYFVKDLVLPFIDSHRDPLHIRETLLNAPGKATNHNPYTNIFAIDILYHDMAMLEADFVRLQEVYQGYSENFVQEFMTFYQTTREWFSRGEKRGMSNRVAGGFSPPAPTTPCMRVRTGRFGTMTGP